MHKLFYTIRRLSVEIMHIPIESVGRIQPTAVEKELSVVNYRSNKRRSYRLIPKVTEKVSLSKWTAAQATYPFLKEDQFGRT
jgi:hypothetical protein